jgi:hypothetical protein
MVAAAFPCGHGSSPAGLSIATIIMLILAQSLLKH